MGLKLDLDDPRLERGYSFMKAMGRTKLALILFTVELARRLDGTSPEVEGQSGGLFADEKPVSIGGQAKAPRRVRRARAARLRPSLREDARRRAAPSLTPRRTDRYPPAGIAVPYKSRLADRLHGNRGGLPAGDPYVVEREYAEHGNEQAGDVDARRLEQGRSHGS